MIQFVSDIWCFVAFWAKFAKTCVKKFTVQKLKCVLCPTALGNFHFWPIALILAVGTVGVLPNSPVGGCLISQANVL